MPFFAYILAYFLLEALAFWGVSKLIGVGWALIGIFVLIGVGAIASTRSLRSEMRRATEGRATIGQFAGGTGLVMVGWVLAIIPGYVSSCASALLLIRPTRELMRASMAASMRKRLEEFGVQMFEASPMGRRHTSYGTFGTSASPSEGTDRKGFSHGIIDADVNDIKDWSENARPEDFGDSK